jgi:hypothetical protein
MGLNMTSRVLQSGIIATNKHVVNKAFSITVTLQDGSAFPAQLLGKGVGNELAMLKIDAGRCNNRPALYLMQPYPGGGLSARACWQSRRKLDELVGSGEFITPPANV